jgi:Zn-finger nucleic acid-binding protein
MLQGRCPKCGLSYYGWSLLNPRCQTCPKCGGRLEIGESDDSIPKTHASSTVYKYTSESRWEIESPEPGDTGNIN